MYHILMLVILLFHKFISTVAFWAKEANITRCILQFLDILIFEEIYVSHKKIVTQFKQNSNEKSNDVETTTSFKFVRNLEAIFESIPQSVLQLVFIIRTSARFEGSGVFLWISILSIMQSIISMGK